MPTAASTPHTRSVQNAHAERWKQLRRAAPDHRVQLRVALTPRKSDTELEQLVHAVSDVTSPTYGQYASSAAALAEHYAPPAAATAAMERLAASVAGLDARTNAAGDIWTLRLAAREAEALFATELFEFAHARVPGLTLVRPRGAFAVPEELAAHVAFVDGLESFPTEAQAQFMAQDRDPFAAHRPASDDPVSLARDDDVITPAIIREQYDIPDSANASWAAGTNKLVIGTFLHEFFLEEDLAAFLAAYDPAAARRAVPPKTRGDCVARRAGSMASRATGEASLDIQVAAALARSSDVEMLCYTGLRNDSRPEAPDNQEPFLTFLLDVNAMEPPPAVVSISYTDDECSVPLAYALAVNRELMKAALRGVSVLISAGDAGSLGSHLAGFCGVETCSRLLANFPASSPFVTAVGATTIDPRARRADKKRRERVTSTRDGALITSGGGFSELFARPAYQDAAVAPYLAAAAARGLSPLFAAAGRGYPDVAALGHAFPVVENGRMYPTDGTSVSAPLVAAMVALANKQRLAAGRPALGFLNPLLYALARECPHVFADVADGDTACGSPDMGCCARGHFAARGWDAASGLGTLRLGALARDLDACLARARAAAADGGDARPPAALLLAESERERRGPGPPGAEASLLLLLAVAVAALLVAGGRRARRARLPFDAPEPAREYLLARDPSRA